MATTRLSIAGERLDGDAATSRRMVSPVLAGREEQLAELVQAFDSARGGETRTVLVEAEAGGGKTRLVRELALRLGARARTLVGGCAELGGGGQPYGPFLAIARTLLRGDGDLALEASGGLASLLKSAGIAPSSALGDAARSRLFADTLALFEGLAGHRPLLLVIEDLQWADPSSRVLLEFLVANLRAPVLLVATLRSEELRQGRSLRRLVAALERLDGVGRLTLPLLSRREVAVQLGGILGRPPDPAVVAAVYHRGGGLPLFSEALVTAEGVVRCDVPGALRNLLLAAVDELPETTRSILRAAALGGSGVGDALLAAVTGVDGPPLVEALRPAVESRLLVEEGGGYAFRHALIRQAIAESLLATERERLHQAYATALESRFEGTRELGPALALACHWRGTRDATRALASAWSAARLAADCLAYGEQLEMLEQVLALWPHVPAAAARLGVERADVRELAADAACWAAETERGLVHAEAALSELDAGTQGPRVAALLLQRAALREQGLLAGDLDDLRAALALAPQPTRLRAECLGQLCRTLLVGDRAAEAAPLAAELQTLAARLGDEEFRIEAEITLGQIETLRGVDATAELEVAQADARRLGSTRLEVLAYIALTAALEARGELHRAIALGRAGLACAAQAGQARYRGVTIAQTLGRALAAAGQWAEADEVIDRSLALDPSPFGRSLLLLCRGEIAVGRGDLPSGREAIARLQVQAESGGLARSQRAAFLRLEIELHLAAGDSERALAPLASGLGSLGADPSQVWPLLATGMRAATDAAAARSRQSAAQAARCREALVAVAAAVSCSGPLDQAHRALFLAETARGAGTGDAAAWDTVAAAWERLDQPARRAYALLRAGEAAAAAGARGAAGERWRNAHALARTLGAQPLLDHLARLARRARLELDADRRPDERSACGLTGRELDVLRLLTEGRSNRSIGDALFIATKTVSVHVSNILGKLGVASRGEAVAEAHRLRLFDRA
jgi:ATP/maltotriose-dependent transcriptional regulator MalT